MALFAFVNNDLLPAGASFVPVQDLALQRGYAVFDFLRVEKSQPLFLVQHLKRFFASAHYMRLAVGCTEEELAEKIKILLAKNSLPQSGLRITLTGGPSADGITPGTPTLIITQQPITVPAAAQVQQGISLITYNHQRQLPQVKTTDYLMAIWLQPHIKEQGADEVLYCNNGFITECPRANFFMVTADDVLVTPAENILGGITRSIVLQLAKEAGYTVEERSIAVTELTTATAAFVTSTTKKIVPVRCINSKMFEADKRSIALHLLSLFEKYTQQHF